MCRDFVGRHDAGSGDPAEAFLRLPVERQDLADEAVEAELRGLASDEDRGLDLRGQERERGPGPDVVRQVARTVRERGE